MAAAEAKAEAVLEWLRQQGSAAGRDGLARCGTPAERALGAGMAAMQVRVRPLGRDHAAADRLAARDEPAARSIGRRSRGELASARVTARLGA